MRYDGASQLAEDHKWEAFPSASIAYRITQENFMAGTKSWLEDLKIRLSYGVTGNQAIDPYQTQGTLTRTTYAWNETNAFGYRPLTFANKNLTWESTAVLIWSWILPFYKEGSVVVLTCIIPLHTIC